MMGEEEVIRTFVRASQGADIGVIEGVMGMFDGLEGSSTGSTADVARILSVPVILIVDVSGISRSAHAIIHGYSTFDPEVKVGGVIFNRVGSRHHRQMIESSLAVPVYGWIPVDLGRITESRHLGLFMASEDQAMQEWGPLIEKTCDLDTLLRDAKIPSLPPVESAEAEKAFSARVAVAHDPAFCFYYEENLRRLERRGGNLSYFSPLQDRLPDADLLYLGGGYPELHAGALASSSCTRDIFRAAESGMPIYAECGGLTYLCRKLQTNVQVYHMVGVLPADVTMYPRFQALGYIEAESSGASPLLPKGLSYRGHEFHYSALDCDRDARFAVRLSRGKGIQEGRDGLCTQKTVGTYCHAYFTDVFADALLAAGKEWKKQ
jgi:cobyrinic acid a,c-diamide synthase